MSKFYAQSGSRSIIIIADDAVDAASKLVDQVLGDHVWIYGDETLSEGDRRAHIAVQSLLSLGSEINVSVRGESRSDAGVFSVAEIVNDWHRMMTGLSRIFGEISSVDSM